MDNFDLIDGFFEELTEHQKLQPPPSIVSDTTRWCVLDLETGGFSRSESDIAEIAIVAYEGQREVSAFEAILRPYGPPMQAGAVKVHQITHQMRLRFGVEPERVFRKAVMWLERMDFVVAYNATFDRGFMQHHVPQFTAPNGEPLVLPELVWVDPLDLAQRMGLGKSLANLKLGTLTQHYGIPLVEAHRALADSRATAGVLLTMLEHHRCSLEEYGSGRLSAVGEDMVHLPPFEAIYGGLRRSKGGKAGKSSKK